MTDERLIGFARLLRQNGLRVSPGEVADAARALSLVPMQDRDGVRAALRSSLVKRAADAALFDRLFDLYFGSVWRLLEGLEETLADGLSVEGLSLEELQQIADELGRLGTRSPLAEALVQGNLGELARLLRAAALRVDFSGLTSPLQKGFFARRVSQAAGVGLASTHLEQLPDVLSERGLDPEVIERVSQRLTDAMQVLEDTVHRAADLEFAARDRQALLSGLAPQFHLPLATLSPGELEQMRDLVKRLAARLETRLSRRRRAQRRGQLHLRATLRGSLGVGGIPMRLAFRRRRRERPDVVVLCDVSESVRTVSRLMLLFLHTLQSQFSRVRSFVFVSDLGEVTDLLRTAAPDDAADGAVAGQVVNLAANSNYGRALELFHDDFRGALSRRTTLVIIGDGRSNHAPAKAWVLKELRRRARRIVWLCPEGKELWGQGDSEMRAYARHCDRVHVVRTVDELARAAEDLLPRRAGVA